jgi:ubiquinone/menaquinone biosynthesis C-methylase UbiE
MSRGIDGLTVEELRSSREFWDDRYTRELLDAIPATAGTLVEIGCGLARAAHELLPHRTELHYIGVDVDPERLAQAGKELATTAFGSRARLLRGAGEELPLAGGAADCVLTAMTLQHVADVGVVLNEAHRILAPDGALVAVEPDYMAQQLYFDGRLDALSLAFAALRAACQAAKQPADHNIGPRVPSLMRAAGFREIASRVHCLQGSSYGTAAKVGAELLEMADILAATAAISGEAIVQECQTAVERWRSDVGPEALGYYAWFVPVFVTRGRR